MKVTNSLLRIINLIYILYKFYIVWLYFLIKKSITFRPESTECPILRTVALSNFFLCIDMYN